MVKPQLKKKSEFGQEAKFVGIMALIGLLIIVAVLRSNGSHATDGPKGTSSSTPLIRTNDNPPLSSSCQWRPEPLQGICDVTKSTPQSQIYKTAVECEEACCKSNDCITFQFRTKEGCLFGGDTRLGAEKDGVSAWCEPRSPDSWHGQRTKSKGTPVEGACSPDTANMNELNGQCFGLGPKRPTQNNTPESCREACCADANCGMWQWRKDAGCFYNKNGHGCNEANPEDLEAFVGKRKVQSGRTYSPYAYTGDFADMATGDFADRAGLEQR